MPNSIKTSVIYKNVGKAVLFVALFLFVFCSFFAIGQNFVTDENAAEAASSAYAVTSLTARGFWNTSVTGANGNISYSDMNDWGVITTTQSLETRSIATAGGGGSYYKVPVALGTSGFSCASFAFPKQFGSPATYGNQRNMYGVFQYTVTSDLPSAGTLVIPISLRFNTIVLSGSGSTISAGIFVYTGVATDRNYSAGYYTTGMPSFNNTSSGYYDGIYCSNQSSGSTYTKTVNLSLSVGAGKQITYFTIAALKCASDALVFQAQFSASIGRISSVSASQAEGLSDVVTGVQGKGYWNSTDAARGRSWGGLSDWDTSSQSAALTTGSAKFLDGNITSIDMGTTGISFTTPQTNANRNCYAVFNFPCSYTTTGPCTVTIPVYLRLTMTKFSGSDASDVGLFIYKGAADSRTYNAGNRSSYSMPSEGGSYDAGVYFAAQTATATKELTYNLTFDFSSSGTQTFAFTIAMLKLFDTGGTQMSVDAYIGMPYVTYTSTVSYNGNGGSVGTSNATVTYGTNYGNLPAATRTGYLFDGWSSLSTGLDAGKWLPSEYQRVEYLRSTSGGGQYIDVGFKPNYNSGIEVVAKLVSATSIFGVTDPHFNVTGGSDGTDWFYWGASTPTGDKSSVYRGNKNTYGLRRQYAYRNGNLVYTFTNLSEWKSTYDMTLFGRISNASGGFNDYGECYIYACKIWDNDVLIRDYVPCYRKSDGVRGMFDLVYQKFYTNAGSGTFDMGPIDVNVPAESELGYLPSSYQYVDYVQSSGTQYINTGVKATSKTALEIDAKTTTGTSTFGVALGDNNFNLTSNGVNEYFYWGSSGAVGYTSTYIAQKNRYKLDQGKCYINGNLVATTSGTFNSNRDIYLFGRNGSNALDDAGTTYIYGCKIWEDGFLVRNYIPCYRISDSVIGLYDTITGVFYTNAGTGTFVAGASVSTVVANKSNATLYAMWTPIQYKVVYNANLPSNATSSVSNLAGASRQAYNVNFSLASAPTLIGWTFGGWYRETGCTNSVGDAGATVGNLASEQNATVNLYAKWTVNTYTVTVNTNGGTIRNISSAEQTGELSVKKYATNTKTWFSNNSVTLEYDQKYNLYNFGYNEGSRSYIVPPTGYHYGGLIASGANTSTAQWAYYSGALGSLSNNTLFAQNHGDLDFQNLTPTSGGNVVLTVQWLPNTYTVTFNMQNGSGGSSSVTATYDSAMPSATMPTRTGYTFGGYYDGTNGSGTQYYTETGASARSWNKATNTDLYAKWTMNSITVSGQPSAVDRPYNANSTALTYTTSHPLTISYQWYKDGAEISGANSASYNVKAVADSGDYYCIATVTDGEQTVTATSNTVNVHITTVPLTFHASITGESYVYNGQTVWETRGQCYISGIKGSDMLSFMLSRISGVYLTTYDYPLTNNSVYNDIIYGEYANRMNEGVINFGAKNVGEWTVKIVGVKNVNGSATDVVANYYWAEDSDTDNERMVTFSVTQKELGLSWGTTSFTYDAGEHKPTCQLTGIVDGDSCSFTLSGEQTNVGNYTATASNLTNSNYKLPSVNTTTFTIAQKEVGLSWGNNAFIYNRTAQAPTCTATGVEDGDTCDVTVTGAQTAYSADEYTATASSLSNSNYKLPSANTTTFTIAQKEVGLSWGNTSFTYNRTAQAPTCTATGVEDGDTCDVTVTGAEISYSANEYTATASSLSNSNYKLPTANTTTFTIAQKEVGLSWGNTSFTYNRTAQAPTCTATGVEDGDTCTVTVIGAQTAYSADEYTATASSLSNSNYKLPSANTTTFTIAQKEVGLSWGTALFTYDANEHIPTCELTGVVDGDSCSFTLSGVEINAGNYTATASELTNDNYKLPEINTLAFTIAQKEVGLSWGDTSFTYNRTAQAPTCTATGVEDGDTCIVTVTGEEISYSANEYTATASSLSNSNYKLPSANTTTFTIAQKEVGLSWGNNAFIYNRTAQAPTCTATGVENGDTCIVTVTGAEISYSADEYTATASSLSNGNYKLPSANTTTFTIARKEVGLSWGDTSFIYNGEFQAPTCTATKVENGDSCVVTVSGAQKNYREEEYTATASALSNSNYKLPAADTTTFTIAQKEITLAWTDTVFTYDGEGHKPTCTAESIIDGDECEVTVTGEQVHYSEYAYTATASSLSNSNYKLPTVKTTTFTVNQKSIAGATVTLNGSLVYNGKAQQQDVASVIIDGLNATFEVIGNVATHAGDYTLTVRGNGDYTGEQEWGFSIARLDISEDAVIELGAALTYNGSSQKQHVASVTVGGLIVTYTPSGDWNVNAGDYTLTIEGTGDYTGQKSIGYTIAPKALTIRANAHAIYYGDEPADNGVTIIGLVEGDELEGTLTFNHAYARYNDIGTYEIEPQGLTSGNYIITYENGTLTVNKKEVTAVLEAADEFAYGTVVEVRAEFPEGMIVNNDNVPILLTYVGTTFGGAEYPESPEKPTEAGSYTLLAKLSGEGDSANYSMEMSKQFSISKSDYAINDEFSFSASSFIFDGQEHTLSVVMKKETSINVSYENNGRTNVGQQTVRAIFSGYSTNNYNEIAPMEAMLTITPRSISGATIELDNDLTYNGEEQEQLVDRVYVTLPTDAEPIVLDVPLFRVTNNTATNAGNNYSLTVTGEGNFCDSQTAQFIVRHKDISDAEITLGAQLIYNGYVQQQSVALVEVDGLTVPLSDYGVSENTGTNVGEYELKIIASGNFCGEKKKAFTINAKDIAGATVTMDTSPVYTGTERTQTVLSVVIDGLHADFTTEDNTAISAGNHTLKVKGTGNFFGTVEAVFEIVKAPLTATANDNEIYYGSDPSNAGVTFSGFVNGEDESILSGEAVYRYTYTQFGDVGNYYITVSGFTASNYEINYAAGVLTVHPYVVTLHWSDTPLRYIEEVEQCPSVSVDAFGSDSLSVTQIAGHVDVGQYVARATKIVNSGTSTVNNNYALPSVCTYNYSILPALVAVPVPASITYVFNDADQSFQFESGLELDLYSISGDVRRSSGSQEVRLTLADKDNYCWVTDETNEDRIYIFTIQKRIFEPPVIASQVYTGNRLWADATDGTYYHVSANDGGVDVGVYTVAFTIDDMYKSDMAWTNTEGDTVEVDFEITQATNEWQGTISVRATTYGQTLPTPSAKAKFGTVAFKYRPQGGTDNDYTEEKPVNAGRYYVLIYVDGTDNYTYLSTTREFTIQKANLDGSQLEWVQEGAPFTFDGTPKSVSIAGLPDGVEAVLSDNEKIHAGQYQATVTFIYDQSNYNELTFDSFSWEILPMTVTAVWSVPRYAYNGQERVFPRASFVDVDGNTVELIVTEKDSRPFVAAGQYTFIATSANTDYTLEGNSQSCEIAKKKVTKPTAETRNYFCTAEEQTYGVFETADYEVLNNVRTEAGSQEVTVRLRDSINCEWRDGTTEDIYFTFTIQHRFSEHNGDPERLESEATCTEKAVYSAVCVCGEMETYEYGEPLGHDYHLTYTWTEEYTASAHVTCTRCDYDDRQEAVITTSKEGILEYYHATVILDGVEYVNTKQKGAVIYNDHVYNAPVWTWTWENKSYVVKVAFYACDGSEDVQSPEVSLTENEQEESISFVAVTHFGDTNKEFRDEMTIEKVRFRLVWSDTNVFTAFIRPGYLLSECIDTIPTRENATLSGFTTAEKVYIPYDGTIMDYPLIHAEENITAVWQERGTLILTAKDESGRVLSGILFSLLKKGVLVYQLSTDENGRVVFGDVPYGTYNLQAQFSVANRPITRDYTADVTAATNRQTITIVQDNVSTRIIGDLSAENLESIASDRGYGTVTVVLDTTHEVDDNVVSAMNEKIKEEAHDPTLVDFFNISVTEEIMTTASTGSVSTVSNKLTSSEQPLLVRYEISTEIYSQLIARGGSPEDVVVYTCSTDGLVTKLPRMEYAHDSTEYYHVVMDAGTPYVVLSVNNFTNFAIGLQNTVIQAVNDFISLTLDNWVYGTEAKTPVSSVKYGTVKYLYAKRGTSDYSETIPTKAGEYQLKAYVEAEEEYSSTEKIIEFTVEKATYDMSRVLFSDRTVIADGQEYTIEILGELPEGVSVVYEGSTYSTTGEYQIVARFYGDEENYNIIPQQTATLVIEDQTTLIIKKYKWVFLIVGGVFLLIIIGFIIRPKGKGGGGGSPFNYRIGG